MRSSDTKAVVLAPLCTSSGHQKEMLNPPQASGLKIRMIPNKAKNLKQKNSPLTHTPRVGRVCVCVCVLMCFVSHVVLEIGVADINRSRT